MLGNSNRSTHEYQEAIVTANHGNTSIPVVDVDQAFPAMVDRSQPRDRAVAEGDLAPQVNAALRDVLGWRPRVEDPKAFIDALGASFRLVPVEGHIEAHYVPRGYAVQADLGAVTGGQASLYRRALVARAEILRILGGLTPLRTDADADDMEAYRSLVRGAVQRLVDEIGGAGGPRVQMVDSYFRGLTGARKPNPGTTPDGIAGQLGALRDRFGLIDANVNTVEEEGVRTSFWTLVDMITDLHTSWDYQRKQFSGGSGQGFLGTELILLSRLMEAAGDQVEELEAVLDSVLISASERRTLVLDTDTGLTLDGLLMWLRTFLGEEGRHLAQDTGRDGIVSALAPTAVELVKTFKRTLADRVIDDEDHPDQDGDDCCPVRYLPASCCAPLPAGMYAARTRIAVASLCRLLLELARTAQRIGRYPAPVLTNVLFRPIRGRNDVVEVELRGFNLRPTYLPAFLKKRKLGVSEGCRVEQFGTKGLLLALRDSATADDERVTGLFRIEDLFPAFGAQQGNHRSGGWVDALRAMQNDAQATSAGFSMPAEDLPIAIVDGESGTVVHAPEPRTWPNLRLARNPVKRKKRTSDRWDDVPSDERFAGTPQVSLGVGKSSNYDTDSRVAAFGSYRAWRLACQAEMSLQEELSELEKQISPAKGSVTRAGNDAALKAERERELAELEAAVAEVGAAHRAAVEERSRAEAEFEISMAALELPVDPQDDMEGK
jgi:hypothetical protein